MDLTSLPQGIEALVPGPCLELFARQSDRSGWTFWGNEITRFNSPEESPTLFP
jgi:N6-adenosine-specific RNA methylase IME4